VILILGYGMIGSIIAKELSEKYDVVVIDKRKIEDPALKKILIGDVFDFPDLIDKAEVIISALPAKGTYEIISKLLSKGKKVIDISSMPEDPMNLNEIATKEKGLLIPQAGYSPGLTNLISGYFYKKYRPKTIEIRDGGLPIRKVPPLDYTITWSVSSLINMYLRPARIVKNKKIVTVDPLENIEQRNVPEIGDLETIYIDSLKTLLHTLKDVDNMFVQAYRYPGHLQKIKFLRDMGYFSETAINGCSPRSISEELFQSKLKMNIEDLSILEVRAFGNIEKEIRYIDYFDKTKNITSMARMTGFPPVVLTELLVENKIDRVGVAPLEYFGFDESTFNEIMKRLRNRGLNIRIA